ncbi:MAG: methylated-DNA--[protein]-cysteine S-methyltransferase [Candidatus Omnitrophota bacterium]
MKDFKLEAPTINEGEVLLDATLTPLGWLSYALTHKGLKEMMLMYKTVDLALFHLASQKIHGRFSIREDLSAFLPLLEHWRNYFLLLLSDPSEELNHIQIPIDDTAWTEIEKNVYYSLRNVEPGQTMTYGELAAAVGKPRAARFIGNLMKKNPLPLVIPCHRVVGKNGRMCGFSGEGGIELKKHLLEIEKKAMKH